MRASTIARVVGLTIALSIVAVAAAMGDGTSSAQLEGHRLYDAGRFAEAIPYFDQVLERHPRDTTALNLRGICFLRTDQPEKALADFDRINANTLRFMKGFGDRFGVESPTYAEAHGNRGICLLMLGRDQDALESFLTSTRLWSWQGFAAPRASVAAAYQGLGQAYHRLGQEIPAGESYNKAISVNPTDPNGFAGRGEVLASQRMFDQAIADFNEAIRLDPSHARAFASRGIVSYGLGRDEAALADLDKAVALDPTFARAHSYRGAAHSRRGQNELALADYDAVIRLMPQDAGAYKDRGGVLVRLGRFEEAIKNLDEAIRLDPKRSTAYQNRGLAYTSLGHYERAIDDLTEAIKLDPENAGAYSNRGRAHFATGGYDEAIVDLSLAIKLEPRNAITYFNRAEVFARLGINDRALQDYTAAVQLAPNLAPAYAAIGRIQSRLGRREEAIRDYDMALKLDPKGVDVFQDRGNARREGGDWLGALADYDRAIAIDPKRADLYVARGTPREAETRRLLDEALTNLDARAWPVPILRYFRGDLTEAALVESASGPRRQTEVHAFVGLERLQSGDRDAALAHLKWVREHGAPGSIAFDVARAALGRIEPGR